MNLVDNNFKSSYNHSFGRRNIVNYPHNIYVNKEVKKNLKIPIFREKYLSTYETSFGYKKQEGVNYYQRTSVKVNLKRLHEEYLGNPVKPHGTTTGKFLFFKLKFLINILIRRVFLLQLTVKNNSIYLFPL